MVSSGRLMENSVRLMVNLRRYQTYRDTQRNLAMVCKFISEGDAVSIAYATARCCHPDPSGVRSCLGQAFTIETASVATALRDQKTNGRYRTV